MSDRFLCATGGRLFLVPRSGVAHPIGPATPRNIRLATLRFRPYAIVRPK